MSFEPVFLGRTGRKVSRLGIGSSYGTDQVMVEAAVEHGVNYLYWGAMTTTRMAKGIRAVASHNRENLFIVFHTMNRIPSLLSGIIKRNLKDLKLDYFDLILLGWMHKSLSPRMIEEFLKLKERGLVHFVGISSHKRKLFPELERDKALDVYHIRYNAAHRGAEKDVFPFMPEDNGPGLVTFTSTSWGSLLNPKHMPHDMEIPRPRDCYRFVLSNPDVHVAIAGPNSMPQLLEDLKAIDEGPMNDEELSQMRLIGDNVYKCSDFRDQIMNFRSIKLWGSSS